MHLGVDEVDNSFVLEDVNLLNARNSIYTKSLQSVLQPLVIGSGSFVGRFMLSSDAALSASAHGTSHLHELLPVHAGRDVVAALARSG